VTFYIGPTKKPFQIPEDLLIQHSQGFGKLIIEARNGTHPKSNCFHHRQVKVSTFEDFFVWLHTLEPGVNSKSFEAIIDLAILAEQYDIFHLRNQTSDILRERFYNEDWRPTPEQVTLVYGSTQRGALIRQLCSCAIAIKFRAQPGASHWLDFWTDSTTESDNCVGWGNAFRSTADLGWDYFVSSQQELQMSANMMSGGPCRFHDHSEIHKPTEEPDFIPSPDDVCPYPHGAPLTMDEIESNAEDPVDEGLAVDNAPVDNYKKPEIEQAIRVVEPESEEVPPPPAELIAESGPRDEPEDPPVAEEKVPLDADTLLEAFFPRKSKKKGRVTFEEPPESEIMLTPGTSDASDHAHDSELSPATPDNDLGRGSPKQKYAGRPLFGEVPYIVEASEYPGLPLAFLDSYQKPLAFRNFSRIIS
jgi:hypothetical protein